MGDSIIDFQAWLQTPAGRYLLEWERSRMEQSVADIFGYHALQLGLPELDALQANRMPHQWLALDHATEPLSTVSALHKRCALVADFTALPFPASSLDLVVLPHTLESSTDPHATLREVERVLVPEGRVVIGGLNPWSLWGLRQWRGHQLQRMGLGSLYLPSQGAFMGLHRLRDWLRLLSLEVEVAELGCYRAAVQTEAWLQRLQWMDRAGPRWWPIFGAAYFVVAVKRVRGMRVLGASWKATPVRGVKPVSLARSQESRREGQK